MAYVVLQFGLLGILYWQAGAEDWFSLLLEVGGIGLGLVAVATMGWFNFRVLPDLKEDAELRITGIYHWVRHPMYTAVACLSLGWTWRAEDEWSWGSWFLLLLVLWSKSRREELQLLARFPEYGAYQQRTAAFIPGLF